MTHLNSFCLLQGFLTISNMTIVLDPFNCHVSTIFTCTLFPKAASVFLTYFFLNQYI